MTPAISVGEPSGLFKDQGYLSMADMATYLGVTISTVRAWRKRGLLPPAYKFGRLVRWSRATIDQWVAARAEETRKRRAIDVRLGQARLALRRR